jgi:hypothetical protein
MYPVVPGEPSDGAARLLEHGVVVAPARTWGRARATCGRARPRGGAAAAGILEEVAYGAPLSEDRRRTRPGRAREAERVGDEVVDEDAKKAILTTSAAAVEPRRWPVRYLDKVR